MQTKRHTPAAMRQRTAGLWHNLTGLLNATAGPGSAHDTHRLAAQFLNEVLRVRKSLSSPRLRVQLTEQLEKRAGSGEKGVRQGSGGGKLEEQK